MICFHGMKGVTPFFLAWFNQHDLQQNAGKPRNTRPSAGFTGAWADESIWEVNNRGYKAYQNHSGMYRVQTA